MLSKQSPSPSSRCCLPGRPRLPLASRLRQPGGMPPANVVTAKAIEREIISGHTFVGTVMPKRISTWAARSMAASWTSRSTSATASRKADPLAQLLTKQLEIELDGAKAERDNRKAAHRRSQARTRRKKSSSRRRGWPARRPSRFRRIAAGSLQKGHQQTGLHAGTGRRDLFHGRPGRQVACRRADRAGAVAEGRPRGGTARNGKPSSPCKSR